MRGKKIALMGCLALLGFGTLPAAKVQNANVLKFHKMSEKSKTQDDVAFYSASDNTLIALVGVGAVNAPFTALPFTQYEFSSKKSIKPNRTKDAYSLKKGAYLVLFTGTFKNTASNSVASLQVALRIGTNGIFTNMDTRDWSGFDSSAIMTISKVIKVKKDGTELSIIANNTSPSTTINVTNRSISIIKLK